MRYYITPVYANYGKTPHNRTADNHMFNVSISARLHHH